MKNFRTSLPALFHERVLLSADKRVVSFKSQGTWIGENWQDFQQKVFEIALALQQSGVSKGDRVGILSQSRYEWLLVDWAILSIGAVTVPIYPSLLVEDVFYILQDAAVKFLFIEDNVQKEKLIQLREKLPGLSKVVSFVSVTESDVPTLSTWREAAMKSGDFSLERKAIWKDQAQLIQGLDLASIVYTSGTSGQVKGVCLTHRNFLSILEEAKPLMEMREDDLSLNYLPLSHVLGRIESLLPLCCGSSIAFSTSLGKLMEEFAEVRPTIFYTVPRFFDKIYQAVVAELQKGPAVKRGLSRVFLTLIQALSRARQEGTPLNLPMRAYAKLAEKLVFEKLRAKLGGKLRYSISGGAPLSLEVASFFHAAGILVLEGYGLTESTGPVTINTPKHYRFGTVGRPLRSARVEVLPDGELQLRGPMVTSGYLLKDQLPVLCEENVFPTGDIGTVDAQGFVKITDRKKDIIVLAGGKNVAPQKIEGIVRQDPIFSNAIIVGDKEKYVAALLTLNVSELRKLARNAGFDVTRSLPELLQEPSFNRFVQKRMTGVNKALANFETVRRYRVLPRDLSVEAGELTPSLKVKRRYCTEKYKEEIASLYVS